MKHTVILMGIKHCGKTTQGKLLAQYFRCPFYDTDDMITALNGRPPREIYRQQGKGSFMTAETEACRSLSAKLAATQQKAVVAAGGGICDNTDALRYLQETGVLVFLQADEQTVLRRILREARFSEDGGFSNLPAYLQIHSPRSRQEVQELFHLFYERRRALYAQLADITFPTEDVKAEQNSRKLAELLQGYTGKEDMAYATGGPENTVSDL